MDIGYIINQSFNQNFGEALLATSQTQSELTELELENSSKNIKKLKTRFLVKYLAFTSLIFNIFLMVFESEFSMQFPRKLCVT